MVHSEVSSGKRIPSRGVSRPGSIVAHKVNFTQEERTFPKSDVPRDALAAKIFVLAKKTPDILGEAKPDWVHFSGSVEPIKKRFMQRTLAEYSSLKPNFNYRAEVLPKESGHIIKKRNKFEFDPLALLPAKTRALAVKPGKTVNTRIEMEIHPALRDKEKWNVSTEISQKALEAQRRDFGDRALKRSREMNKTRTTRLMEPTRHHLELLTTDGLTPSERAELDTVHQMQRELKDMVAQTGTKSRKYAVYEHPGTWELSQLEGKKVWSCCMAEREDSRGCARKMVNPDRWMLEHP